MSIGNNIIKPSKQVSGKHGLHKPNRSAIRRFTKTHSRAKNLYAGQLPETSRCDVFPLTLGPETEPLVGGLVAGDFSNC